MWPADDYWVWVEIQDYGNLQWDRNMNLAVYLASAETRALRSTFYFRKGEEEKEELQGVKILKGVLSSLDNQLG